MSGGTDSGPWTILGSLAGVVGAVVGVVALMNNGARSQIDMDYNPDPRDSARQEKPLNPPEKTKPETEPDPPVVDESPEADPTREPDPPVASPEHPVSAPSPPLITAPSPLSIQPLTAGASASLMSLTDTAYRYVATIRFENSTDAPLGIAVLDDGFARAQATITDLLGGSCQMISNGEGWGSLDSANDFVSWGERGDEFRIVPSRGGAQHTIYFNKGRCDSRLHPGSPTTINIAFVLMQGQQRNIAQTMFADIAW